MKRHILISILIAMVSVILIERADAREIGFIEDFSLADNREEALQQLVPGSSEYYYYHCLHAQNSGDFKKTNQLVEQWIKRDGYNQKVAEILNRQALLTYDNNPEKSLEHIKKALGLSFDHYKDTPHQQVDFPHTLDPNSISTAALTIKAFSNNDNLEGVEAAGLDYLDVGTLNPTRRRDLLNRLVLPDIPNLAKWVVEDLKTKHSGGFGSLGIHYKLTRSQLDECLKLAPDLKSVSTFIHVYLTQLAPSDDTNIQFDSVQRKAYLESLWQFAKDLKPAHNSLKAHVLFHLLDEHRSLGNYDHKDVKKLFMTYLKIPRQATYVNPNYVKHASMRDVQAVLTEDFEEYSLLPQVNTDESLVRDYLSHYFIADKNYKAYAKYISDNYLQLLFAETKIINSIGDMEQWYSLMPPAAYQSLKDRVDLDFSTTNKVFFTTNEPVELSLNVKNVKTMIVKVFEINTFNYYQTNHKKIDTTIELDGLVATHEKVVDYNETPFKRTLRTFEFLEIDKPGVYVIEFIGNGKSSRAVIRKGNLYFLQQAGPDGHEFTIYDDSNEPRPEASIYLAGQKFKPNKNGVIVIPFTDKPEQQDIIIKDGVECALSTFKHEAESYTFTAGIFLDRESLIKREKGQVLIRPMLKLNGQPVSLSLLEQVQLTLESTNIYEVSTTKEINNFELFEDKESTVEFQVPENLQSIGFTLRAKVENISQHKKEDVIASAKFNINSTDTTLEVENFHLSRENKGYVIELLGKNGEKKKNTPVNIEIKHRFFTESVNTQLKTDADGRVHLGLLEGIQWVKAQAYRGEGVQRTWGLSEDMYQYPATLHGKAGGVLKIPFVGSVQGLGWKRYALFERRGNAYYQDLTDRIKVKNGFIVIDGLDAGNYELYLKDSDTWLQLRLTRGKETEGYIISENRVLEVKNTDPLHISAVDIQPKTVVVHLENATDASRLHLFGTRFLPAHHPFEYLSMGAPTQLSTLQLTKPESHYVAGRNIGDEYRYILERAHTDKFPGNMLGRPEQLLTPWSIGKTETSVLDAEEGDAYERKKARAPKRLQKEAMSSVDAYLKSLTGHSTNIDFLSAPSVVRINLKPDENGRIAIDRKTLGQSQHIHLVAVDNYDTVYRQVALEGTSVSTRELRQTQGLDPEKHFGEQKKTTPLMAGETFQLTDISNSEYEIYDALKKVYDFMMTANENKTLREFGFVLTWPELTADEKRENYTKYACHELNIFLYHKDKEFFSQVVLPYITNKKDKTFVDNWLLSNDLSDYLAPWAYNQLNIVEKILLAKRYPDETSRIARHIEEGFDMIPPDIDQYNQLFDIALSGKELSEGYLFTPSPLSETSHGETGKMGEPVFGRAVSDSAVGGVPIQEIPHRSARNGGLDLRTRSLEKPPEFFQKLDKTKEWAENNYYKLPIKDQNGDLITINAFWKDYAFNPVNQPFYSKNFIYATQNFTEMMLALSVLDLPFKSTEHESDIQNFVFTLKASSPMIVFHKQIKPVEPATQKSPILVHQNYFQSSDPVTFEGNEQHDKFVTDEFLFRTAYGCQVVIGNPTSSRQKIRILLQVPSGAIPVKAGFYTKSIPVSLEPFATRKFEYHFYFPETGQFKHYPVQVTKNEEFLSSADPQTLNVVDAFTLLDKTSWNYISQNGSEKDVLEYIENHNLNRIDLDKIAFRMHDRRFFEKTIKTLKDRHFYHPTLWSYGLLHKNPVAISTFLQHSTYVDKCGTSLSSSLLNIDPVERKTYQHLEYKPLVNGRAHQLGGRNTILNDRFHKQYHQFMKVLSYRNNLTNEDLLDVTNYLLAQDRVKEAFGFFQRLVPSKLVTRIQYDYLHLYFNFYMGNTDQARTIATKYENYPVLKWRKMFRHAQDQLNELEGQTAQVADTKNRDQRHAQLASKEVTYDFKIESRKINIQYQNVTHCQLNYYPMNIELLFSQNPFVQHDTGYFTYIRPNHTQVVKLPEDQATFSFDLPEQFHNSNLMVEVEAGGVKKSRVHYANSLDVQIMENYGQLKVAHRNTHKPLPTTYIKTYARMHDGSIAFHKDGYTDLRGKFDYVSLNTSELDKIEKFAILILNEKNGAVVQEVKPPKR